MSFPWSRRLVLVVGVLALSSVLTKAVWADSPAQTLAPVAVFQALVRAYPDRVAFADFWATQLKVGDQVFAWSEGRLLPVASNKSWQDFAPQPFYAYPRAPLDVAAWSPEQLTGAEDRLADRTATRVKRDPTFFDALWEVHNRGTADDAQRKTLFLNLKVTVHRQLVEPLARVEARLNAARVSDPSLDQFLKTLDHLEGYNWRDIAGTQSRSNHSYGTAIDTIPRTYGRTNPYWLWAPQGWPGWYLQAWNRRWQPHPAFVQAFEAEGFVWGGKWLQFDTIHFEYRPEILILNGLR